MTRFYCTICKKVKRVRRVPFLTGNAHVTDDTGKLVLNPKVEERKGECLRHAAQFERRRRRVS